MHVQYQAISAQSHRLSAGLITRTLMIAVISTKAFNKRCEIVEKMTKNQWTGKSAFSLQTSTYAK